MWLVNYYNTHVLYYTVRDCMCICIVKSVHDAYTVYNHMLVRDMIIYI